MKKIGSKILSLALAMLMMLGLAPETTYAAEDHEFAHTVCIGAGADHENCQHQKISEWEPLSVALTEEVGEDEIELSAGYYYLDKEIATYRKNVKIKDEADVVICLNGYKWSLYDSKGLDALLKLGKNTTLQICDCSYRETGSISGNVYAYDSPCTIELYSGTIKRLSSEHTNTITFNMYGGKINAGSSNTAISFADAKAKSNYNINIYDGEITGKEGIAIYGAASDSKLNIYGGTNGVITIKGTGTELFDSAIRIKQSEITVNVENASIIGKKYGIYFNDCDSAKNSKLKISGYTYITSPDYAIYTYNTIDIEGNPEISGNVYCYAADSNADLAEPYPMFNITGPFDPSGAIVVNIAYPNLVVAEGWSKVEGSSKVSDYFQLSTKETAYSNIGQDSSNPDQLIAVAKDTTTTKPKTNAIVFTNGNKVTVERGVTNVTLATLKNYDANRFTVKVYDEKGTLVNVGATVSGNELSIPCANLQAGAYNVSLTETGKNESNKVAIIVEKTLKKPELTEIPTIDVSTPGVLEIIRDSKTEWGVKLVDQNGVIIGDWTKWTPDRDDVIRQLPLDGGEYSIYFCYPEDMVENGQNVYTVDDEYVLEVKAVVEEIDYEEHYKDGDEEFIIDFAGCDGIMVIPSMSKFRDIVSSKDVTNVDKDLVAKYYSYDGGKSWYKLPNTKIVVENTNKSVNPEFFGVTNIPIYNFEVTFRDVTIDAVDLGFGDAVLNVDGNVTVGYLMQHGDLEIVGADKDDTFNACKIEAENDINISNVNTIKVLNPNPKSSPYELEYGIHSEYGDVKIENVGLLHVEAYDAGINGTNVSLNKIDTIVILAEHAGIFAFPMAAPSSESEVQGVGNLSITDCGTIKISGTRWVMPTSDETAGEMKPVNMAIAGVVIEIDGVEKLTISDAVMGMVSEAESGSNIKLSNIPAMDIVAERVGVVAADVTFNNVLGTIAVKEGKAVSVKNSFTVTHNNKILVVSGSSKDTATEMTRTENVVNMDKMGVYFEIIRTFTFESFIEEVEDVLAELPVNNEITQSDIEEIIQNLIDATGEAGLKFTISAFNLDPVKDSTEGSIDLVIEFTYEEGEEDQKATVEAEIKIPLRVYVEDRYNDLGNALTDIFDKPITSANKVLFENALEIAEELLKEANAACLDDVEKEEVEAVRDYLEENLALIEDSVESLLAELREKYNALPTNDKVTSADVEKIVEAGAIAQELLKNYAENLTAEEKAEVESKNQALYEKYEIIAVIAEKLEAAKDAFDALPADSAVTSANKEVVSVVVAMLDELLAKEGNLTATEKAEVEAMKAALEKKLAIIKDVADKMKEVEETVGKLPADEKVSSAEKESIEDSLAIIDELLSKEKVGNLTETEKTNVEAKKAPLEAKLAIIKETADKLEDVKDAVKDIPEDNKVKPSDIDAIKEALDKVNKFLASDVVDNLTAEEKAEVEALKAALEKKLAIPSKIADELAGFVKKEAALPKVDTITSDDKSAVEGLLNSINEFKNTYAGNLTDEQKAQVETLIANLEKRLNKIKELETKIDKIEDDVEAQPTYKDVTSENKEDIKDVIGNIDEVLANNKDNLSEEEIKDLEDQKKELEDMVEFIEKIEKYEPVAGDFENTTDSEENDKKGNLVNKSEELITIIPLDKIEKQHVAKGEKVQVYLVVTDISETVSNDDKDLIDEAIGDKEVGAYIDLTLFKQIGEREASKVPNTNGKVQITVEVPADLLAENANVAGKYQIVRVHEGETTIIDTVFDEATGTITFETDKFSTYALVYEAENVDNTPEVPDTGDTTSAMPIIMLVIGLGLVIAGSRRKFN